MLAVCRGRIPAIVSLMCAATFAGKTSAQTVVSGQSTLNRVEAHSVSTVAENLLRNSENSPAMNDSTVMDGDWVLRDDRRSLDGAAPLAHAPVSQEPLRNLALKTMRSPSLPHVDAPRESEDPAGVNDRLVPVPVLNLGWGLVLSALLFNLGAKVLRIRRTTNS